MLQATLATISEDEVIYEDFVVAADRLAKVMRAEGATFIIALTHMRVPNGTQAIDCRCGISPRVLADEKLARECPAVDLICGGHDHHYDCKVINDASFFAGSAIITLCFCPVSRLLANFLLWFRL